MILPPEEARKIAAGEVVDRPAALVREFIDNALDAGAASIEVLIEEGGMRRVEVVDDGQGMGPADLELCWHTHATSKIRSLDDLRTAATLGFRGEALAAAAAVSRLEILSSMDGRDAWKLDFQAGKPRLERGQRTKGTSVRSLGIFDTLPARKRFLKREASEGGLCRQIFIEKAMTFPDIDFRFTQDGKLRVFFPPSPGLKDRFVQALFSGDGSQSSKAGFIHELKVPAQGFSLTVVLGGPEIYRPDRRQQYVFANGRRIQDFSLLQALEYGVQGFFPNGSHPVGAVYISIDPALADFNIHPAKREVRFADPGAIHHALSSALRDFFHRMGIRAREEVREERPELFSQVSAGAPGAFHYAGGASSGGSLAMEALLNNPPDFVPPPGRGSWAAEAALPYAVMDSALSGASSPADGIRFLGRIFGLFLLAEQKERLYIIDQHAAHERILYDQAMEGKIPRQELLAPIPFSPGSDKDEDFLRSRRDDLARLGVVLETEGRGDWRIEALPSDWRLGDAETVERLLDLRNAGDNMAERWAAALSCRGAIKDGEYLDPGTALDLVRKALSLPVPRCPHGRPIWYEISRETLLKAVRRI